MQGLILQILTNGFLLYYEETMPSYQIVKYVPLMYVNCDKRLELGSLHFGELLCCDFNQRVQQVQELLVR